MEYFTKPRTSCTRCKDTSCTSLHILILPSDEQVLHYYLSELLEIQCIRLMNDYCIFHLECHTVCFSNNNPHLQSSGFFTLYQSPSLHTVCSSTTQSILRALSGKCELRITPYFSKNLLVSYKIP